MVKHTLQTMAVLLYIGEYKVNTAFHDGDLMVVVDL
jgi:hypothetical protein